MKAKPGGDIEIHNLQSGSLNGSAFLSVPGTSALPNVSGEGLQGLAFHPDYETNGFFYVYYFGSGQSNLARFTRSTADSADPASGVPIFSLPQPNNNHNGGWIGFGPDGFLYVTLGDGGSQNDPGNHGQTLEDDLLGSMLRIDVDGDDFPGDPDWNYAIPSSNPYTGVSGAGAVWAYGLRNPFRASFDRLTGDLYIADVGQDQREEIDYQEASDTDGANYGWRLREGTIQTPGVGGAPPVDNVEPIYDYEHGSGKWQGDSVTGGYLYRGPVASLRGKYFFGDFESERIWSIEHDGTQVTRRQHWTDVFVPPPGDGTIDQIVGFGEDALGNLYIVDLGGEVFRVVGPAVPALPSPWHLGLLALLLVAAAAPLRRGLSRNG